jgi:hypothetical protein
MNKWHSANLWRSLYNWYITGWRLRCPCKSQQAKAEHSGFAASLLFLFFFVVHRQLRCKIARILGAGEAISLAGLYSISPIWGADRRRCVKVIYLNRLVVAIA